AIRGIAKMNSIGHGQCLSVWIGQYDTIIPYPPSGNRWAAHASQTCSLCYNAADKFKTNRSLRASNKQAS
ncbi:MAG: hypothetical protein AAFV98_24935, partial [Chloroflexota bacterium]